MAKTLNEVSNIHLIISKLTRQKYVYKCSQTTETAPRYSYINEARCVMSKICVISIRNMSRSSWLYMCHPDTIKITMQTVSINYLFKRKTNCVLLRSTNVALGRKYFIDYGGIFCRKIRDSYRDNFRKLTKIRSFQEISSR